tara:strand:+ start:5338 stop:5985 length:648 start_codon:yes stop_codon:yes gene_type:complete
MKICCVGYRKWALDIYDYLKTVDEYDTYIISSKDEYDEDKIREYNPDYILFYGWSDIINKKLIKDFKCIMLHPSLLPKYRGGSPLQNQIINGETLSAVTLFLMDEGIDTGDIIAQASLSLDGNLDEILDRMTLIGLSLTKHIFENGYTRVKQDDSEATYYKRRTPDMSEITPEELSHMDAEYLYNKIRMLQDPYPNAFIRTRDGKKLKIKIAEIE